MHSKMIAKSYNLRELSSYLFACFVSLLKIKTIFEGAHVAVETHNLRRMWQVEDSKFSRL